MYLRVCVCVRVSIIRGREKEREREDEEETGESVYVRVRATVEYSTFDARYATASSSSRCSIIRYRKVASFRLATPSVGVVIYL